MRVRILLEKKLEMLDITYEILKIKRSMTKDVKEFLDIERELKNIREKRVLIKKLIHSITWENLIEAKELGLLG
ncbi:MAG: hypothetical protein ACRCU6_05735 [Fusobacteriaceae bacterium]